MKLQLEALDPLFFRDGRPFTMGEESYANGIFPPLPSTIRGALRSMWMSQQLSEPNTDKNGLADNSRRIELNYFGLGVSGKPVFPVPLDLFFCEKSNGLKPMDLTHHDFVSSCTTEVTHLFKADSEGKTEPIARHLLEFAAMQNYLDGTIATHFATKRLSNYVKQEHKIGIGRNNDTHLTQEGLLFRLSSNRFVEDEEFGKLSLLVDVDGYSNSQSTFQDNAVMPLGGERRSVVTSAIDFKLPLRPTIQGKLFKVVLVTPGLFSSWFPKHLLDEYPTLKLKAAAVGKPISVGGWDVLNQKPKSMRRAAPAGSVFVFEAEHEEQANNITSKYHGNSICQPTDDLEGFGICFIAQPFNNQII